MHGHLNVKNDFFYCLFGHAEKYAPNGFVLYSVLTVTLQLSAGFAANGVRMVYTDFLLIRRRALLCGLPQQWDLTKKSLQNLHPSLNVGMSTMLLFESSAIKTTSLVTLNSSQFRDICSDLSQIGHTHKHTVRLLTSNTISEEV
jgi:hypothetical protein